MMHLLYHSGHKNTPYLVKSIVHFSYNFDQLKTEELVTLYKNKTGITSIKLLVQLWNAYRVNDLNILKTLSRKLESTYPLIKNVIESHIKRIPTVGNLGTPKETLIQKIKYIEIMDSAFIF